MIIVLKPDSLTAPALPVGQRAQWRLLGEDDSQWKESGALLDGLRPGSYLVESRSLVGRTTPRPLDVNVGEGQTVTGVATYYLADTLTGTAPSLVPFETVTGSPALPYQYVGQFRTDAGSGSGFVVRPRVVATAAHAVFDDGTLSAATGQQWLFQRDRTSFEVKPQTPRGFYIFTGYSAQRTTENTPGTSSPLSQTLDAAAVYFLEDAGRGGFSGYLASDSTPNEWLLSSAQKTLVGYPIDGVPAADQGRMHATPPANAIFTHSFGRTYTTASLRSSGGTSGGPLCVQYQNGNYYPAAIYLGGTGQTVVRVIDSELIDMFNRGEVSANGGNNNTGGGITHTNSPISGSTTGKGTLKVNILPAGAASSARWKLSDSSTVLRTGGTTVANKTPGGYQVYFTSVAGYVTPTSPDSVTLSANTLTTIDAVYLLTQTITFPAITDKAFGDASVPLSATASSGLAVSYTVVSGPATRSGNNLTLTGYGTVTVRASQAGNSSYTAAANVTRTFDVLALTPATWTTRNFTSGEQANPAISGHLADPDGDGICNLLEFGLNLDPKVNARVQMQPDTGTSGLPAVQRNAGGNLTVEYVRRKASIAPGITYSVEFATDAAGAWTAVGTEVATSIDATFERVKVTDTIGGAKRLARLKITAP